MQIGGYVKKMHLFLNTGKMWSTFKNLYTLSVVKFLVTVYYKNFEKQNLQLRKILLCRCTELFSQYSKYLPRNFRDILKASMYFCSKTSVVKKL